jgi:hypothetical protein
LYVLAAAAAGVGAIALSDTAQAKIIYTPTKVRIGATPVPIDLNHDGQPDFWLHTMWSHSSNRYTTALGLYCCSSGTGRNQLFGTGGGWAKAFPAGVEIGTKKPKFGETLAEIGHPWGGGSTTFMGPWENGGKGIKNHYLGLMFYLNDKVHYGWARLSVKRGTVVGTLTGYAYETIPNKAIVTGKTKGSDVITVPAGSLGELARGRR